MWGLDLNVLMSGTKPEPKTGPGACGDEDVVPVCGADDGSLCRLPEVQRNKLLTHIDWIRFRWF